MTKLPPLPATTIRDVGLPVVLDYLLSHLGFFTILPILPLMIGQLSPDASPLLIGGTLFAFNFMIRGASLFCAGVLHHTPIGRAMGGGLVLAAGGFLALPFAPGELGIIGCLVLAGTGISINGLMARVYVAKMLLGAAERNTVFSAVQVAVNVSAALGPLIGNLMFGRKLIFELLASVTIMYLAAALIIALAIPPGLRPAAGEIREPMRLGLFRAIVADPLVRRVSITTAIGSFLYAQFFSAIALHVAQLTESSLTRASVFTLNAICVVLVQIPVTLYTRKRLASGKEPFTFLVVGVMMFGASFSIMGMARSALFGMFLAVIVFSVAETFFTPMVSTAFAAVPGDRPLVELFNLRQIAATVGESLGAFAGGALFLVAAAQHQQHLYWLLLAAGSLALMLPYLCRGERPCGRC